MPHDFLEQTLATPQQRDPNQASVFLSAAPAYIASFFEPVNQPCRAVMSQRHAFRKRSDRGLASERRPRIARIIR